MDCRSWTIVREYILFKPVADLLVDSHLLDQTVQAWLRKLEDDQVTSSMMTRAMMRMKQRVGHSERLLCLSYPAVFQPASWFYRLNCGKSDLTH
jgi:hypothetical protein